jgi:hypothetical protein
VTFKLIRKVLKAPFIHSFARVHHKVTHYPSTPPDNTRKCLSSPPLGSFYVILTRHGIFHQMGVKRNSRRSSTSTQGALSGTPWRPVPSRTHIALRATYNRDPPRPFNQSIKTRSTVLCTVEGESALLCVLATCTCQQPLGQLSTSQSAHPWECHKGYINTHSTPS